MSVGMPTGINSEVYGKRVYIYFTWGTNAEYCYIDLNPSNGLQFDDYTDVSPFEYTLPNFNTLYRYALICYSATLDELSSWSSIQSFTTGPDIPTNVNISVSGLNVTITFTKPAGATTTYLDAYNGGTEYDYSTTTSTFNLSVPWYNYTYYFYLQCKNASGSYGEWTLPYSFSTGSAPVPSPPVITGRFDGGVNLQCGSVSGASAYYFSYRVQGTSTWLEESRATYTCALSGLLYGTAYEFKAKTDLNSTYSSINIGTTAPKKPTITTGTVTTTSIAIRVASMPDNCDRVKVECYESASSTFVKMNWIDPTGRTFPSTATTTFSGLTMGYSYDFVAVSYYDAGGDGTGTGTWIESMPSDWLTVDTTPALPPTPPVITNRFDGGVDLQCGTVASATTYYFDYRVQGNSTWSQKTSTTNTVHITGMQYAVAYEFKAKTDLIETYSSINVGTTLPKKPSLTVGAVTNSSIEAIVGALPGNCDKVKVECYENSGSFVTMNWINPAGRTFPTAMSTIFNNLNMGYVYRIMATSYYDVGGDGTGTGTWFESVTSEWLLIQTSPRPNNWAWSYPITSGGNVYQSSYDSATGVLTAYLMTVEEWWDFQTCINYFRYYKGLAIYNFTSTTHGSGCTVAVVNQCIDAINDMLTTGKMSHVTAGNVSAATFNTMRDKLNSIP